mmetsp:Transcript_21174/g.60443  ORF Transcript_21174/g.60443 Transcript_21174/m.60443 type:complete len:609 (-) Transcript_21174:327-2153(-)
MATTKLQLSLSARDLKNLSGMLAKSDPFAVVTFRGDDPENRPQVVGRTDVVFNNLNPQWSTVIFLEGYKFGVPYYIEVGVFDFNAKYAGTSEKEMQRKDALSNVDIVSDAASRVLLRNGQFPHKVMGTALFEVGEILGSRGNVGAKSLQSGGAVYSHIERCPENGAQGKLQLQLRGIRLKNTQKFPFTSCPYYEMLRKVDRPTGAKWVKVYQSNVARNDLSPTWNKVTLDIEAICNGDLNRAMKIVIWDHRRSGKHKHMGEFETTVHGLITSMEDNVQLQVAKHDKTVGVCEVLLANAFDLKQDQETAVNHHHDNNGNNNSHGNPDDVIPSRVQMPERPQFIDYITGGCQISLAVAIDFTASNGDPRQEGTPHYFHPPESKEWNDYEKAIFAVGSILAKHDSDQRFPVWGFGAKYHNAIRHCFQCGTEIEVEGVQGIMDAYRGVFRTSLTMSYPTKFTEVITTAISYARHEQDSASKDGKLSYTILLILTAGNVEDVQETKECLIEASQHPLSVVIVGIGEADFAGMEFLDDFNASAEEGRDITKFVRFSDYKTYTALSEAVLDEIPGQLVDFYYDKGILPGTGEAFNEDDVEIRPEDDEERTLTFLG